MRGDAMAEYFADCPPKSADDVDTQNVFGRG